MPGIRGNIRIVLIVMAISMIGMCNGNNSTANGYLIRKWHMWFNSLDANHDGEISVADVKESEIKFSDFEHLDSQQRDMVKEAFNTWWDKCVSRWGKEPIREQVFVDSIEDNFNADMRGFVDEMRNCSQLIFSTVDINKDKSISEEELLVVAAAFGHQQIAQDNDFYSAFNSTNGLVPLHVVVDSWVELVTSTDESKVNNFANGFSNDGFH